MESKITSGGTEIPTSWTEIPTQWTWTEITQLPTPNQGEDFKIRDGCWISRELTKGITKGITEGIRA